MSSVSSTDQIKITNNPNNPSVSLTKTEPAKTSPINMSSPEPTITPHQTQTQQPSDKTPAITEKPSPSAPSAVASSDPTSPSNNIISDTPSSPTNPPNTSSNEKTTTNDPITTTTNEPITTTTSIPETTTTVDPITTTTVDSTTTVDPTTTTAVTTTDPTTTTIDPTTTTTTIETPTSITTFDPTSTTTIDPTTTIATTPVATTIPPTITTFSSSAASTEAFTTLSTNIETQTVIVISGKSVTVATVIPTTTVVPVSSLNKGNNQVPVIVGSVIGGLAGIALIAIGVFLLKRKRKRGILLKQRKMASNPIDENEMAYYTATRDWNASSSQQYYMDQSHSNSERGEDDIYPRFNGGSGAQGDYSESTFYKSTSQRSSWWSNLSTSVLKR
ncbi:hypothetical protein BJ944DRAFT_263921, partial [Cunninghamella echinulata]